MCVSERHQEKDMSLDVMLFSAVKYLLAPGGLMLFFQHKHVLCHTEFTWPSQEVPPTQRRWRNSTLLRPILRPLGRQHRLSLLALRTSWDLERAIDGPNIHYQQKQEEQCNRRPSVRFASMRSADRTSRRKCVARSARHCTACYLARY